MAYWDFLWTPKIESHLAEHGVTVGEFESVVSDPWWEERSRKSGLPIAFGETSEGRLLACVYRVLEDGITVVPVTAFDADSES